MRRVAALAVVLVATSAYAKDKDSKSAEEIVAGVVDTDPFGFMDSKIKGRIVLRDKHDSERVLAFTVEAIRYKPGLSKSVTRFSKPADIAGVSFLQVMKDDDDDDRFLYLPELKKSRRISGALRKNSFMGTDFSFADLDLRDLRESKAKLLGDKKIGKHEYWNIEVYPTRKDSEYSKFEMWVRKDNFLVLKWKMYDNSDVLYKTFQAHEMKRVSGHWYVSKARIENHKDEHTTDYYLDEMTPTTEIPDSTFTVRNLEKL